MLEHLRIAGFAALMSILAAFDSAADEAASFWPQGQRAAISLAYDDALDSQLDIAIPALDRHGLKGSFYVFPAAEPFRDRLAAWRVAAAHGHELGNHTLFHACRGSLPGRDWVPAWSDLDHMTLAELRAHLVLANTLLHAIDGQTRRTFTATCLDDRVGGEPYFEAVEDLFVGIKGAAGDVVPDMDTLNLHRVPVAGPVDMTGEQLIAIAERAAEQGTMANYTFHGVGGDYLSVSAEAHEALLRHLAEHPDVYWVDTFLNIMTYVDARRD